MRRLLLVFLIALPAFGKSLHWKSIDVQARLDADGRLRVIERQTIVFDGDWNGGERDLNVIAPQRVEVHGIKRVDGSRELELERGSLDEVDHYDVVSTSVIRWRSRLPGDPPFANQALTYVLDFTYDNIMWQHEDRLALAHDFGMPNRAGIIEQFTLNLEFDPRWNTPPVRETRLNVAPGQSVVVNRTFAIPRGAWPAGIVQHRPSWSGPVTLAIFLGALAALIARYVRDEAKRGRFEPVAPKLDEELMKLRPEVLGAMWDAGVENTDLSNNGVGPSEVAAVLARLTQEGKLESRAEKKVLHMRLLVPYQELSGYERLLISQIFVDGDTMDTKTLKKHYKRQTFNPAETIRPGIHSAIAEHVPRWNAKQKRFSGKTHLWTLLAMVAAIVALSFFGDGEDVGELVMIGLVGLFFGVLTCAVAYSRSRVITDFTRSFLTPALLMIFPIGLFALGALYAFPGRRLSAIGLTVCGLWLLAIIRFALDLMKIRDTPEVLAVRRRALAVRLYFKEQLRQPQPALRDEWFPYLLAFGLGKHADRWFRAFGGGASSESSSSSSWGSSSGSSSASGWTGGGGAFGGAGATGSWAAAAGAIAAGVSSGSSGGSGGGGSSGGGGGGGW